MSVRLRAFTLDDYEAAMAAQRELAADGFDFLWGYSQGDDWAQYLDTAKDAARGINLREGWVAAANLAAEVDGELVGRSSVRFALNDYLAERGGHIGYGVRPQFRRRGYATEILRLSLEVARAHAVTRVLVTCDDDNLASAGVIEKCGGVLESVRGEEGDRYRRYWFA